MPTLQLFHWRFAVREICRRPLRSALTLVGIVLGTAAVTAVSLATTATHDTYGGMFRLVSGKADLEVLPPGRQGAMPPHLDVVAGVKGVATAVPLVQRPTGLITASGPVPVLVLGIDPERDRAVRERTVRAGEDLSAGPGVLLEAGFAARHGLSLGDDVRLMAPLGPATFPLVGLVEPRGAARFNGGAIVFLPLEEARRRFAEGNVTSVQVVLAEGVDRVQVTRTLQTLFPSREVVEAGTTSRLTDEFLRSTEQVMDSLCVFAAVSGGLVILNTFLMNLGERRRQFALLRALGATTSQVTGWVILQAVLLGVAGTLAGLPLGVLLAVLLVRLNEWFLGITLPAVPLSAGGLVFAGLLGPAVTLLAALLPARQAGRRPPLAGLVPGRTVAGASTPRWEILVGAVLVVGVAGFQIATVRGLVPPLTGTRLLPLVVGAALVGAACLLPAGLPALLRTAAWVLPPFLGVEGRLAVRQLDRRRERTVLTAGVIFAALTASISFGSTFLTNMRDIRAWYGRTVDAPFLIRTVQPDLALSVFASELPSRFAEEIRGLPAVGDVGRLRFIPALIRQEPILVFARDFPAGRPLPLILHGGDPAEVARRLQAGEAALGPAAALRLGLKVGDELALPARGEVKRVRVAAVVKEYSVGGMVLYLEWARAAEWFGFQHPHALAVTARPGADEELGGQLSRFCEQRGLLLQRNAEFAEVVNRVAAGVRGMVAGMVALIFLVAAVGIANTLATNILDQTRELGVLRAVGMKRRQLSKMVLAQALGLSLVGCLPGVPAGVLVAWMMNQATPALVGHHVPFHLELRFIGVCVVCVAAVACLAALLPARRAARLPVIEALRYE